MVKEITGRMRFIVHHFSYVRSLSRDDVCNHVWPDILNSLNVKYVLSAGLWGRVYVQRFGRTRPTLLFSVRNHEDESRMLLWHTVINRPYKNASRPLTEHLICQQSTSRIQQNAATWNAKAGWCSFFFFNKTPLSIQLVLNGRTGT